MNCNIIEILSVNTNPPTIWNMQGSLYDIGDAGINYI